MKILIKFPTRSRPQQFLSLLDRYIGYFSEYNEYQVLISCDDDDIMMTNDITTEKIISYPNTKICFGKRNCKIEAINRDMNWADPDWDVLLLAADDMVPIVKEYDRRICDEMKANFPDTDGVLWFNDGYRSDLITLVIMGRKYYERFGYILNPIYRSMYADNEFMIVAKKLNRVKYFNEVLIEHRHYSFNKPNSFPKDKLYEENWGPYSIDKQTFLKRHAKNFEL